MEPSRRKLLTATSALLASASCQLASAATPATHPDNRKAQRYEVQTTLSSTRAGAARIAVHAPATTVEKVVRDYGHYADFIRRFEKSRVIGRHGGRTDVYLQVPILHGAAKVWAVVRFEPPKQQGGDEVIEAHMLKGNVRRLDAWWRIKPLDADHTKLALELLLVPKQRVPGSLVAGEVAYAADTAVTGCRNRAEHVAAKRQSR